LAVPAANRDERLLPELELEMLAGAGVPTAPSEAEFSDRYCAWHVVRVGDETASTVPFLISRNVHVDGGELVLHGDGRALLVLDRTAPLGRKRGVWCVRGAGCIDARTEYLSEAMLFGSTRGLFATATSVATNRIEVIPCRPK
jgi:hypothetical protein